MSSDGPLQPAILPAEEEMSSAEGKTGWDVKVFIYKDPILAALEPLEWDPYLFGYGAVDEAAAAQRPEMSVFSEFNPRERNLEAVRIVYDAAISAIKRS